VDGYCDEPSSLGVPPYLGPHVRYIAGAAKDAGMEVEYLTVDAVRKGLRPSGDVLVVYGGVTVPGTYLRTRPMSPKEAAALADGFRGECYLFGPLALTGAAEHFTGASHMHGPSVVSSGFTSEGEETLEDINRWAVMGSWVAGVLSYPVIAEVELYQGCPRVRGCSFCVERMRAPPRFREPDMVLREVMALYRAGVRHFRLTCPCIFSYMGTLGENRRPATERLEELLSGIWKAAPDIRVLHTDNADPAVLARNPDEAPAALEMLRRYTTSGNVLSFGLESCDPVVRERNNLNATPEEGMLAVELVNRYGRAAGRSGMPHMLPGVNFLFGLDGESEATVQANMVFLKHVVKAGHLLRRINIRNVVEPGTLRSRRSRYIWRFRKWVREHVDPNMISRVVPRGRVLKDLYPDIRKGRYLYARQLGSYPVVCVLVDADASGFFDAVVVDHGPRSVTCLKHPFSMEHATLRQLMSVPGVGKKKAAASLISHTPPEELVEILENAGRS